MVDENYNNETQDQAPPPGTAQAPKEIEATSDEKTLALLAHLLGIFTWFVGALVIWLVKKDSSPYVSDHGREALNFQITIGLAHVAVGLLTCIGIGVLLLPVVMIVNIIFCIVATVAASKGEFYRYPMCLRLIQ